MPVISRDQFRVSVIIFPEDGMWIAQGLQFDVTARGSNPIEASERFNDKFGAEFIMSIEAGDNEPLSAVGAAPREFWTMYENAKMYASVDDAPMRLSAGSVPTVHQDIKITGRQRAA